MRFLDLTKSLLESIKEWPENIVSSLKKIGRERTLKAEEESAEDEPIPIVHLPALSELEKQAPPLPAECRKVLAPVPLGGGSKLFSGREKELKAFGKVLEHWQQSRTEMVALVGPDGSGRTTLLNRLQSDIVVSDHVTPIAFDARITSRKELIQKLLSDFELGQDCDSPEDLVALLLEKKRQVVLVDDVHYLMLRTPDAAEVMRAFLSILLATQDRFLWVISCREQAWRRMDYLYGLSRYFTEILHLSYLDKEECMTALGMRLEACALPLALPPDETVEAGAQKNPSTETTDEDAEEQTVVDGFLKALCTLSHGNLHAALYYWRYFTRYDEAKASLLVLPVKEIDYSVLKGLDRRHLFALGELLLHGRLTLQEHADIFQRDLLTTRLYLDYLAQGRFVEKVLPASAREETTYQVDPVFYVPVASVLESAHILY